MSLKGCTVCILRLNYVYVYVYVCVGSYACVRRERRWENHIIVQRNRCSSIVTKLKASMVPVWIRIITRPTRRLFLSLRAGAAHLGASCFRASRSWTTACWWASTGWSRVGRRCPWRCPSRKGCRARSRSTARPWRPSRARPRDSTRTSAMTSECIPGMRLLSIIVWQVNVLVLLFLEPVAQPKPECSCMFVHMAKSMVNGSVFVYRICLLIVLFVCLFFQHGWYPCQLKRGEGTALHWYHWHLAILQVGVWNMLYIYFCGYEDAFMFWLLYAGAAAGSSSPFSADGHLCEMRGSGEERRRAIGRCYGNPISRASKIHA